MFTAVVMRTWDSSLVAAAMRSALCGGLAAQPFIAAVGPLVLVALVVLHSAAIMQPDEILTILHRDARTSPEAIASMTGRPLDEVVRAIEQYEASGVIKRYTTIIDWDKAGMDRVVAFIDVKVIPARDVGFDAIAARIAKFQQVQSVWLVSGGSDLRLVVVAPNLHALANFVAEKVATIDGVTGTVTHFLLRRYKEDNALFLESEGDNRLVVAP